MVGWVQTQPIPQAGSRLSLRTSFGVEVGMNPRMRVLVVVLFVAVHPPVDGQEKAQEKAATLEASLQGVFEGVEIERQGEKRLTGRCEGIRAYLLSGEEVTLTRGAVKEPTTARAASRLTRPRRRCRSISPLEGPEKGNLQPCIFLLKDDELTFCAPMFARSADKHPSEFKTKEKDGLLLVVPADLKLLPVTRNDHEPVIVGWVETQSGEGSW